MNLDLLTFEQALRHFFDSRREMARCMAISPTTLRQWEEQNELTPAQRGRILGAALLLRRIPSEWLAPYGENPRNT